MLNYYILMAQKQDIFTLLGGKVRIKRGRYNPTSDAVWLAAFCPTKVKTALEVGIGTGGASLCLLNHNPKLSITGIDISSEMLTECKENADLNNAKLELINADIMTWRTNKTFDLVFSNPPYFKGTPAKHNAHHNIDLTAWVKKSIARVKPRGYFCAISDTNVLDEVVSEMHKHCGDIKIFPLFGAKNTAERIIIQGRLGTHGGTTLYSGLKMNEESILRVGLTIETLLSRLNKI